MIEKISSLNNEQLNKFSEEIKNEGNLFFKNDMYEKSLIMYLISYKLNKNSHIICSNM